MCVCVCARARMRTCKQKQQQAARISTKVVRCGCEDRFDGLSVLTLVIIYRAIFREVSEVAELISYLTKHSAIC